MNQPQNFNSSEVSSPLSNALSSLLSNPDMMEKVKSFASQMSAEAPNKEETPPSPASVPADGLSAVLSDPELMAKLPQMMAMLSPMLSAQNAHSQAVAAPAKRSAEDCRNDLLLALKPFLSPERCKAVDTMLRIAKLGTVLRQIK